VLRLAPAAAILAAGLAGKPLLAHWTQTFMGSAARFLMQFFPIFLLGALFGKLMEDSGSVSAIANFMAERLGPRRACFRSYSPVPRSLMAASVFSSHSSCWPRWRMRCFAQPEALDAGGDRARPIALGTSTFTMSALPGTPAIQNAIPMSFFGTTPFAAPGLGHHRLDHHA